MLLLDFDHDFLLTLDIGAHDDEKKGWVVKKYERAWWIGKNLRNLDLVEILDKSSINRCLETHWCQLLPSRRGVVIENQSEDAGLQSWFHCNCWLLQLLPSLALVHVHSALDIGKLSQICIKTFLTSTNLWPP